jgi:NADH-quinone oxidoreductase subunit J
MEWTTLIFYLIAAVSVLAALGVVVSNNPVHSGVFLVLCFFNTAAAFVMLGAEFLAVVQVIVYTGAILVLVLFVLMLVDPDDLPEFHGARPVQRAVGLLLGLILLLEVGAAILNRTVVGVQGQVTPEVVDEIGNTQLLGRALYSDYLLAFEVASLVLLVGIIGAIVLALPERLGERIASTRRGTISLGHPRGTDLALPAGPRGESPIPGVAASAGQPTEREVAFGATRELIKVKDAESYTEVVSR